MIVHLCVARKAGTDTYLQHDGTFGPYASARLIEIGPADHGVVLPPDAVLVSYRQPTNGGERCSPTTTRSTSPAP